MTAAADRPPSSGSGIGLGSVEPRLWTPPLRELTPETSVGFDQIEFARDVLRHPLDPPQEWLAVHAGELLSDGRPRFRFVLVLMARQNGKTEVPVVLTPYWLSVERREMVLGTSAKVEYAKESWEKSLALMRSVPELAAEIPVRGGVRRTNGEQTLTVVPTEAGAPARCRYKIAAANRDAGRSLTVERLILDELRQHADWETYDGAVPTTNAVADAQVWMLSNQGDDTSVVLDSLRDSALHYIKTGEGDPSLGLFEWSAPTGSSPTDPAALAMANPNVGRRVLMETLLNQGARALAAGGRALTGFQTEVMCMRVRRQDPAIDELAWRATECEGDLSALRDRVAACFDVSLDGLHATLAAAAVEPSGRVRPEVVRAWSGPTAVAELRRELPELVARVRPRVLGWFPAGPAAAVAARMAEPRRRGARAASQAPWPPRGVKVEEIRSDAYAVCMGFAELVKAGDVVRAADALMTDHVTGAERVYQGDVWRFTRRGGAHVDAAYATAGAVHLARLVQPARRPMVVVSNRGREPTGRPT